MTTRDSAVSAQGDEGVLDNVSYKGFCDSEEIRMAFFSRGSCLRRLSAPFSKSRETLRLYLKESFEKHSGLANECVGQGGAAVREKRGRA